MKGQAYWLHAVRYRWRRFLLRQCVPPVTWLATPFKVGSEALFAYLTAPRFFEGGHLRLVAGPLGLGWCRHFTVKCHTDGRSLRSEASRLGLPVDRVMTAFRAPEEIFVSALFQDIANPVYPYAFGTEREVLEAKASELAEHFFSFDWCSFTYLSLRENSRSIAECCGFEWADRIAEEGKRAWYWEGPVPLGVVHIDGIRNRAVMNAFFRGAGLGACAPVRVVDVNSGEGKWYAESYRETRRLIRRDPRFAGLQERARADLPGPLVDLLDGRSRSTVSV